MYYRTYLKATSDDFRINRDYEITIMRDLFSNIVVQSEFGRVGCNGRTHLKVFNDEDSALKYYRSLLKRRQSLLKRTGTAYKIIYDNYAKSLAA